ncbi:MAG: DUF1835 domain-containing protein [Lentisphaeria bacterium]|nr:DUF1835 domain-containing protein [Lentisphaeria bacterium]
MGDAAELHILNGDFALKLWQKCGFQGKSLVWRETYLEGPLPETDDLIFFRSARAEFLSHFAELAQLDKNILYKHLQIMDETLLDLPETAAIFLWFDACLFDQTILMRILYLLNTWKKTPQDIFLYCCKSNCLTEDDFKQGRSKMRRLLPQDLMTAGKAWIYFQRKDAENMLDLANQENFEHLPEMKKALLRCAEEIPDNSGLTRTQRQILQLVSNGKSSFMEIFKGLDEFEEYPFLGDTSCQRHLDLLVEKNLLEITNDGKFRLISDLPVSPSF